MIDRRQVDDVAARQRDVAGDAGALGADGLLGDLDEDLLALAHDLADGGALGDARRLLVGPALRLAGAAAPVAAALLPALVAARPRGGSRTAFVATGLRGGAATIVALPCAPARSAAGRLGAGAPLVNGRDCGGRGLGSAGGTRIESCGGRRLAIDGTARATYPRVPLSAPAPAAGPRDGVFFGDLNFDAGRDWGRRRGRFRRHGELERQLVIGGSLRFGGRGSGGLLRGDRILCVLGLGFDRVFLGVALDGALAGVGDVERGGELDVDLVGLFFLAGDLVVVGGRRRRIRSEEQGLHRRTGLRVRIGGRGFFVKRLLAGGFTAGGGGALVLAATTVAGQVGFEVVRANRDPRRGEMPRARARRR